MANLKKILLCSVLFVAFHAKAQESPTAPARKRGDYALVAYAGGGVGYYLTIAGVPSYLQPKIAKLSPVTTLRILWHPDHKIRVGIETGYLTFLSYKLTDSAGNRGKVNLDATPLLIEWSMALSKRFNVFAGSGVYFLTTRLDYAGKTTSNKISLGWMAAVSYVQPVFKDLGLGTELKWLDAAETTDGSISLQLQLVWKFLKW
jgi:hypothetical protein